MPLSRKQKPRVVLDSNIWVSALIWGGLPAKIIRLAEKDRIQILISTEILAEINRILSYEKLASIIGLAGLKRSELLTAIVQMAKPVSVKSRLNVLREDPSDNRIIECATDTKAHYILSGDKHLLRLGKYRGTLIITPREFLEKAKLTAM